MMEIKFKFWNKEVKIMSYPIKLDDLLTGKGSFVTKDGDYIALQYTGLKDKNNKEIYEGDCVFAQHGEHYQGFVEYQKRIIIRDLIENTYELNHYEDLLVIGNIYENPELISK